VPTEVTIRSGSNPRSDPPPPDTLRSPAQLQELTAAPTPLVVVETAPVSAHPDVEERGAEARPRGAPPVVIPSRAPSFTALLVIVALVAVAIGLARHFGLG
jgi:hypothetical protein